MTVPPQAFTFSPRHNTASLRSRVIAKKRLGDLLIEQGKLTPAQLQSALAKQRETKGRVGETLIQLGYITEGELVAILTSQLGLPQVDPEQTATDADALAVIPEAVARRYTCLPIRFEGKRLIVAMADPLDYDAIKDLGFCSGATIHPVLATRRALLDAIDARYGTTDADPHDAAVEALVEEGSSQLNEVNVEVVPDLSTTPDEMLALAERSRLAPIIRLANLILTKAVKVRASDIHIESERRGVRVRYRVDGLLREDMRLPKWVHGPLVSRIKVLAKLDIAERRLPQDGAVRVLVDHQELDLRVSAVPMQLGEKIVIRVLGRAPASSKRESFGMSPRHEAIMESLLRHHKGLILTTGPTGSGKTTTLFRILRRLATTAVNIATVEDPVEYQVEGVNHMQVNADIGLTFAVCLRALLRQDPDVILIGEIRDAETAQIAVRAGMTGHLVLSTLHTNDAPSTLARLVDLGVPRFLVASQVVGIIAQRLVRRLCTACRREDTASEEELLALRAPLRTGSTMPVYRAVGCAVCHQTGYAGRIGIHELLVMTSRLRELVMSGAPDHEIQHEALAAGMVTLFQDGLAKVKEGETSIEELLRVVEVEGSYETLCGKCQGVLHSDFLTCPACGTPVANRCPQCGKTLREEWTFCPRCRRKDDHRQTMVLSSVESRRGRRAANE
ncbi:MAG: ATPase, T2SS/T4P/T4SS family [Nitrospirota bacterium]